MSIHSAARANPWLAWLWPLVLLLAVSAFAQDTPVPVPPLSSPVTDLTQTLTAEQRAALESRLRAYEAQKGTQIAVLIVPTTQPETIEQYSIRVADQWKIGRQDVDDGVILLVAKNDRAVRIEVGTGLEGAIPDVLASRIISQVIVPRFRQGDFAGGIDEAITRIIALLEGEPLPEPEQRSSESRERSGGTGNWLPVLLMFVFVGSNILRGIFGRVGGAFATAGLAGGLMWLLTWTLGLAIIGAILAFVFTLLTGGGGGFGGGRGPGGWTNPRRRSGMSDGWIFGGGLGGGGGGRSSGGFGGGGLGGGGWSGGGGGFSGGGASGRW
jgi:uncharacterized protein